MDNKINFTGSFVIKKPGSVGWKKIMTEMIPETSFFKGNFLGKGNMFVAVSDRFDKEVATYLINKNLQFSYIPDINLKAGICNLPVKMIEVMVSTAKALTDEAQIKKYVAEVEKKFVPKDYIRKENDHIPQTMNALRTIEQIPVDSLEKFVIKGVTVFVDKDGKLVAKASPNNPRGFNFIRVFPRYHDEDMHLIKTDYKGNINYDTCNIDKLRLFNRDFLAAVASVEKK